jgi:hypothetical protein
MWFRNRVSEHPMAFWRQYSHASSRQIPQTFFTALHLTCFTQLLKHAGQAGTFAAKFANVRAILAAVYTRTFARGSSG